MAVPKLDIILIDTYNLYNIAIGDMSFYPSGWNIISPSVQITPPGYNSVNIAFTANSLNLYDSESLGITCTGGDKVKLPDGLYKFKYSITPAYTYYVEKTFMKVDGILEKLDELFISTDIAQCDEGLSDKQFRAIRDIEMYIQFSMSSAKKCANKYAIEAYQKAVKLLYIYQKSLCNTC